jgi:hypothetical protein
MRMVEMNCVSQHADCLQQDRLRKRFHCKSDDMGPEKGIPEKHRPRQVWAISAMIQ